MSTAAKFGLIALVALVLTAVPGGVPLLDVLLTAISLGFLVAIGLLVSRLYMQYRSEIFGLGERRQAVLYGSIGLAALTFCATSLLFDAGGAGAIVWLALLALASYGIYWVWTKYRAYE